ncbi:IQ domain-containing protein M isoform X6 [Rhineura floridana]|uniref:IQ domain-containing protein M isoform X6 n=1 Tax=Rhineura floridana TaxID=261503 RepID=UPI002AC82BDB|nr:IQ domain-containing protein M isoform X6 [Rhineura floridana]
MWRSLQTFLAWGCILHSNLGTLNVKYKMWLSDVFTRVESLSRSMEREKDKQKRSIGSSSNLLGLSSNERNETAWIPKTQYATNIQWHTAFEHGHFKYDIYMACTLTDERKNIPRLERGNIIRDHASVYNAQQPGTSTKINNNNKKAKVQGALTSGKYQKGKAHAGDSEDWKDALQAKSHGSNLLAVVKEYRKMMFRIKRRCGILDPTTPLIFEQLEDWLDHKRFYETMFAKREFLKEMDRNDIPKFFRDCGLFPSPAELNNIMKMVLEGADSKIKIITKTQAIEMAFMLYPPRGLTLITAAAARSTWLKPIVDGEDGYKYLVSGHPVLKAADIRVAGALVAASIRERKRKEREANQSALSGDSD